MIRPVGQEVGEAKGILRSASRPTIKEQIRMILIAFALLAPFMGDAQCSEVTARTTQPVGQWIWSPADERIFIESRRELPDLLPALWVSTIAASHGTVSQSLGRSPMLGRSIPSIAIVVRFEDSVHELWKAHPIDKIGHDIDSRLHRLMELLAAADVRVGEVQLDYDCPVRRLRAWAQVVHTVGTGSLKGKNVWITSIPVHLDAPKYSAWFRGAVKGHILQLFDIGISCNQDSLQRLSDRLRRQGLPFRIGLGAFDRVGPGRLTDHQLWFSALSFFEAVPGYQGVWIFPGGRKWLDLYPFRETY